MERWWQPAAYYCSTIPADRLSSIPLFPVHAVGREQGGGDSFSLDAVVVLMEMTAQLFFDTFACAGAKGLGGLSEVKHCRNC